MTFTTKYINTMEDLQSLLFTSEYDPVIMRYRSLKLFRGIPDAKYTLQTSLRRRCKGQRQKLEESILDNFSKYAELEDPTVKDSVWRKMILGQHHGLPTRLLDWTRSPLMALHFAMTEGDMDTLDRRDCAVWVLDVKQLHSTLPEKYIDVMKKRQQQIFTVDMLQEVCSGLSDYDKDMKGENMLILEPPSIDSRIVNQYSFFSILPSEADQAEDIFLHHPEAVIKYIINRNIRWQIRDFLDQANINERLVYPGLDGIAQWIARHYFVRDITLLHIEKSNIIHSSADVWVNSTDTSLSSNGSVSTSIFKAAGEEELRKECLALSPCNAGSFAVTSGGKTSAKRIVHAVCRSMMDDPCDADMDLSVLYTSILQWAKENQYHSIAFPLLGSGYMHYPAEEAWRIGLTACYEFLYAEENKGYPMDISFCVLDENMYVLGTNTLNQIKNIRAEIPLSRKQ